MAMAARNSRGLVIVQVERLAEEGSLNPRSVHIPGILVDCVVVARPENHLQTYATANSAALSGQLRVPLDRIEKLPLDERKIVARRAAFELPWAEWSIWESACPRASPRSRPRRRCSGSSR